MGVSRSKVPLGTVLALGITAVLACSSNDDEEDDDQFREDVIWCEEAVARLRQCCPGFDARGVTCRHYYSYKEGCGTATETRTEPAFTKEESRCVFESTCDSITTKDVCARAAGAGAARTTVTSTSSDGGGASSTTVDAPPPRDRVCP